MTWTTYGRRSGGADGKARSAECDPCGTFDRRGEVARYIGRHGNKRVAMAVLISSVPPLMLKDDKNPGGLPMTVFDGLRTALAANRPAVLTGTANACTFYGYNRPGATISEGIRGHWWYQGMMGGMRAHYDCIKAFFGNGLYRGPEEVRGTNLVMHGDDDQIVPSARSV